jgi:dTDP-4-amino-4,6-dideoxygalactose transaminase
MNKNYYGYHKISRDDKKEVLKALSDKLITKGRYVHKFENEIKKITKSKYSSVCNNGTSALYLAIKSLNLKKNSYVLIPSINFLASSNVCRILGYKIIFVDVEPSTGLVSPEIFQETLNYCLKKKIKPKLFLPQFHAGQCYDAKKIFNIAKKKKIFVIEDACHAFGSFYKYKNKYPIGSCKYSNATTFSFHPVKNITTGEGGAITTNSKKINNFINCFKNHGMIKKNNKSFPYTLNFSGLNFRISDINCALGVSQIKKIRKIFNYKKNLFNYYKKKLQIISSIKILEQNKFCDPLWHLFIIFLKFESFSKKNKLINFLDKNKIGTQVHYIPVYKHKIFSKSLNPSKAGADKFFKQSLSLPFHLDINKKDIDFIIKKIKYGIENIT